MKILTTFKNFLLSILNIFKKHLPKEDEEVMAIKVKQVVSQAATWYTLTQDTIHQMFLQV